MSRTAPHSTPARLPKGGRLRAWMRMSCQHFITRASLALDARLSLGARLAQWLHRAMCVVCRTQEQHLHTLRQATHTLGGASTSATEHDATDQQLSPEARARLATLLKD